MRLYALFVIFDKSVSIFSAFCAEVLYPCKFPNVQNIHSFLESSLIKTRYFTKCRALLSYYAQISSRIGGAIVLLIASVMFAFL